MEIFKTQVSWVRPKKTLTADTIEYDGKLWIVPKWIEYVAIGRMQPVRIIRLDILPHEKQEPDAPHDFVLKVAIPRTVYERGVQKKYRSDFEVVESPSIFIDIPPETGLH